MKTIEINAGERIRVIHKFSNSLHMEYNFDVEAVKPGEDVSGIVEIRGSNWLFPKETETASLEVANTVSKGMWDTFYSVYVTPEIDVRVSTQGGKINKLLLYLAIGAGVLGVALAMLLLTVN